MSILGETLGAEALSGGSAGAGMLAALAVAGWVFIGFDCCVGASEETRRAARHVPLAIWLALLSVGVLVILNAFAVTLAHPDLAGSWPGRPRPGRHLGRGVVRVVVGEALRRGRARGVPRLRDGRADGDGADDVLGRPRRRAPGVALPAPRRPAARTHRRDRDDRRRRLPRPPARTALRGRRQPHHLRHGRNLRRVPARRARRASSRGSGGHGSCRPRGSGAPES